MADDNLDMEMSIEDRLKGLTLAGEEADDLDFSDELDGLIKEVRWLAYLGFILQNPLAMPLSSLPCLLHGQQQKKWLSMRWAKTYSWCKLSVWATGIELWREVLGSSMAPWWSWRSMMDSPMSRITN